MDVTPYLELNPAPRMLFEQAARRGGAPRFMVAAADGWTPVSWSEFAAQVRAVAGGLIAHGFRPGDRAAVFAPNSVSWLAAAFGSQAARGVMVPIYASNTPDQLAYIVSHAGAVVVFVDSAALAVKVATAWPAGGARIAVALGRDAAATLRAAGGDVAAVTVDLEVLCNDGRAYDAAHPGAVDAAVAAIDLDDVGLQLYTSGTSGPPKGVPLSHRNVGVNGRDWLLINAPVVEEGDTDLLWLPMSHIFGYGEACLGNTLGFVSYLCDPAQVLGRLADVKPHVLMSVPLIWDKLAQFAANSADPKAALAALTGGRLRFCLSGGAGLKREVKEFFRDCGLLILEGYGLTEASPTLTLNRPDAFRFDSVGKPLPSVEVRLADDGEILARGPSIFSGYHRDPEATATALDADGWLHTGDVGRFTEDGFLQIIDRKKDILVTAGGKNVPPANIELQFADEPLVAHAVVYGDGRPYLVALLWPNAPIADVALADVAPAHRPAALRERLAAAVEAVNAGLARHETIRRFGVAARPLTVEGGQLTPTLKIRRKRIYDEFRAEFEALYRGSAT